jgi:DNA invertase Pin-like site-specific DNA recombinase
MLVGYARTSTTDQQAGLEAQERHLRAAGCEEIFAEQTSAVATKRPELERALGFLRKGDCLAVTKPCRLARSTADLLNIVDGLTKRGVGLRILSMGGTELDTRSPTSALMLTILAAIGQFERELMLERQREGIRKAALDGKYKGRAPTARRKADMVTQLRAEGLKPVEIARRVGISRASVYRLLGEVKPPANSASSQRASGVI